MGEQLVQLVSVGAPPSASRSYGDRIQVLGSPVPSAALKTEDSLASLDSLQAAMRSLQLSLEARLPQAAASALRPTEIQELRQAAVELKREAALMAAAQAAAFDKQREEMLGKLGTLESGVAALLRNGWNEAFQATQPHGKGATLPSTSRTAAGRLTGINSHRLS